MADYDLAIIGGGLNGVSIARDAVGRGLRVILLEQGIQPGATIGVSLSSAVELIIAIVAIAKIGGVYLPLDSSLPPERVKYMLKASHASLLLTRAQFLRKRAA